MQPAIDVREGLRVPSGNLLAGEIDVVFVGSGDYHAEYPERDDLLRFLRDRYGDRFLHHGRGGFPVVREQALTDLYHAARVVVGDSCFANQHTVRNARYWSDRIPETLGRGGRLLHPWIEGMADRAWIGQLVTYRPGDWDSLGRAIDDRIDHDPVTNLGRWIARASVLANDTWDHRVRDILATVGLAIEEHA
jgi:hypothetical protein